MENKFNKKSIGLPGGPNEYITHISDLFSIEGYKRNSPDVNNKHNLIPSGSITMKDVDFPVHGVDNLGNEQDMYPGEEYEFPGDYVFETPMAKYGGGLLTKTMHCTSCNWKWKAADGGSDITTCHKCGGEALPKAQEGIEVPKRIGSRKNADGTESTHMMATETLDGKNWFSFPTLFQNQDGTWLDMSAKPWQEAYEEAKKRKELIDFGTNKEAAIKFGEGSWKPKMQKGAETKWLGNNLDKNGYITSTTKGGNRISFTGNQRQDEWINKQIDSGKFGFDPKTGGTFSLKKPVKGLSKEMQFMGTKQYYDLRAPEGFTSESQQAQIEKLPGWQQDMLDAENTKRRKKVVYDGMQEVVKNPLFYAPGAIALAPIAAAGLTAVGTAAAPYVSSALATQLPGMAAVPGATVGNAITAGFAGHGLAHVGPDTVEMYKNPSWENAFNVAMDIAEVAPVAGSAAKTIAEGYGSLKNINTSIAPELRQGLKTAGSSFGSSVDKTGIISNNLNDLTYAKDWAKKYGYKLPENLERIAKQADNAEDAYSLARQPLNPFQPLPRNTNAAFNFDDFRSVAAENPRTVYSLDKPNYISSSELRDQADFLAGQSPLKRMLNKPIIPYTRKYVLPKELELKATSAGSNVRVNLIDKETDKVQAYLSLNKYDDDWLYPGMINVDSKLQGNRIQDILYQKGIEESQKLGFKGVRSGDHLLSPDKTLKAHSRFEKVPLEAVQGKTIDPDIPIAGLTNHVNPRLYEDFFKHYESLPKDLKAKHSINDVYKMFSRHLSDNKSSYGLAATGLPTLAGMTDLIGMPMVDPDYEPYILDWIREREKQKRKEEKLLKAKEPEFQQGTEVKYSEQNGNVVTTTKKVNTPNGPRYYQAQSPDYNFSRELVDAKAATRVGDSIPAIKLDPRILEALKKKQTGGEETSWTAYFNPANWGTSRYDEYATFKEAFRAARAEEDSDFLWKGKRYSTELAKPYKPSTPKQLNLTGLRKGIAEAESRSGLLMVNPESTATGLYGQRFSELEGTNLYKGTRQQFAKDLAAQNKIFETRLNKGIAGNRGLIQDAEDLYSTYSKQIPQFGYSKEDLIALTNFLGRQGTRNYLGYHVRDKKPLAEALPNIYGNAKNQANKTPEDYLKIVRDFYQDGGSTETMQEVVEQPQEQTQNNNVENQYLEIYKKYVSGELVGDEELEGKKIFDKLNRVYYAEAKKLNMKPANYIMTNIIGLT